MLGLNENSPFNPSMVEAPWRPTGVRLVRVRFVPSGDAPGGYKRRVPWSFKFGQPSLRSLSHRPFKRPNRFSIPRHGVLREPTNDKTIVASRPVVIVGADLEPTDRRDDVHYDRGGMDLVPAGFHVVPIIDLVKKSGRWSVVLVSKNLKTFCA